MKVLCIGLIFLTQQGAHSEQYRELIGRFVFAPAAAHRGHRGWNELLVKDNRSIESASPYVTLFQICYHVSVRPE